MKNLLIIIASASLGSAIVQIYATGLIATGVAVTCLTILMLILHRKWINFL